MFFWLLIPPSIRNRNTHQTHAQSGLVKLYAGEQTSQLIYHQIFRQSDRQSYLQSDRQSDERRRVIRLNTRLIRRRLSGHEDFHFSPLPRVRRRWWRLYISRAITVNTNSRTVVIPISNPVRSILPSGQRQDPSQPSCSPVLRLKDYFFSNCPPSRSRGAYFPG